MSDSALDEEEESEEPEEGSFEKSKKLIEKLPPHFVLLLIGSRGSGKTYTLLDLLCYFFKRRFSMIVIVSPTWLMQKQCTDAVDGQGVIVVSEVQLSEEILSEIISMQIEIEEKEREPILVIYDDTGVRLKEGKALGLTDVLTRGRHSKVSLIILAQKLTMTLTVARSQADAWILFREENPLENQQMFQYMGFNVDPKQTELKRQEQKTLFFKKLNSYTEAKHSKAIMIKYEQHWTLHPFISSEDEEEELQKQKKRKRRKV